MSHPIKTVAVVSTGVIGSSFILLFLTHGHHVLVCSPSGSPTAESKLRAYLATTWPTLDPSTLAPTASPTNWTFVGASLAGHWDAVDFVQENSPERLPLKRALVADLDAHLPPHVPICSSTSGLVASAFAADCKRAPGRVMVGHPFNPPHLIPLVEVVPHGGSDEEVVQRAVAFYRSVGRKPVVVRQEVPGFVANRLQAVLLREAFTLVLEGVVSAEEVDLCVTDGPGLRWPFSGPYMGNVLGGGGTRDSFKHQMNHLAPAAQVWYDDIDAKSARMAGNTEGIDRLDASVQKMLEGVDLEQAKMQFGKSVAALLQMKREAAADGGKL